MAGTASTTWLDRVAGVLGFVRSGKAAPPLYDSANTVYIPIAGPLTFPGWDRLERTTDEARARIAIQSSWVFSDIKAIANELSTAALTMKRLEQVENNDGRIETREVDVGDHPLEMVWKKPNPAMGQAFVAKYWVWQIHLRGEAYLWLAEDQNQPGVLDEIWPIPSWWIQPDPKRDGFLYQPDPSQVPMHLPKERVVFSRFPNPFDPRRGMSPLIAAMIPIETDLAQSKWNRSFFSKQNAVPTGLAVLPKDVSEPHFQRIRSELMDFFGGGRRGVAVTRSGDLDYKMLMTSQKDMDFLAGRAFSRDEIDRIFGIPEGYWAKDATRANAEGAKATMLENAVWPLLVGLAQDLDTQVLPAWFPNDTDIVAGFEDIRPRNRVLELQEFQAYTRVLTIDELREMIGHSPIGDVRGLMLPSEIDKAAPIPTSEPSNLIENALAEQQALLGDTPPDDSGAPTPEELPAPGSAEDTGTLDTQSAPVPAALPDVGQQSDADAIADTLAVRSADLRRWQSKAIKTVKMERLAIQSFTSDALSDEESLWLRVALIDAPDVPAVKHVFHDSNWFKAATLMDDERPIFDRVDAVLTKYGRTISRALKANRTIDYEPLQSDLSGALLAGMLARGMDSLDEYEDQTGLTVDPAQFTSDMQTALEPYVQERTTELIATTQRVIEQADAQRGQLSPDDLVATALLAFSMNRAMLIAVTETTKALSISADVFVQFGTATGLTIEQFWMTERDRRVCPICTPLDGAIQAVWTQSVPHGPPAHPRCRCRKLLQVV